MSVKVPQNIFYLLAFAAIAALLLMVFSLLPGSGAVPRQASGSGALAVESAAPAENDLAARFAELSGARTNFCAGPDILRKTNAGRLQGSCCSAMDFHRYKEQIEGLKKYSGIEKIPSNPYDIPISLAEDLLDYQKTISLSPSQQSVYGGAVKMSHEGGPCCCKCWRWYAFEGLAKYLITEHNFSAGQIAEVWNLEDGCGGAGHVEAVHHVA